MLPKDLQKEPSRHLDTPPLSTEETRNLLVTTTRNTLMMLTIMINL